MAEYIEREALLDGIGLIKLHFVAHGDNKSLFDIINEQTSADVAPVRHGSWGNYEPYSDGYRCSCCKLVHRTCTTYCPNCGAKMMEG